MVDSLLLITRPMKKIYNVPFCRELSERPELDLSCSVDSRHVAATGAG